MSAYLFTALFYLFLLLVMCGTLLCGQVHAKSNILSPNSGNGFTIFEKNEQINNADQPKEPKATAITAKEYYSPVLVANDDFFVALTGVNRTTDPEKHTDILTKHIKENELLDVDNFASSSTKWKKQSVVWNDEQSDAVKIVKGLLAVAAGKNVYVLHVNYTKKTAEDQNSLDITFSLSVGAVNDGEREPEKKFVWNKNDSAVAGVADKFKEELQKQQLDSLFFNGSAFLTDDKKIVFALVAGNGEKTISALMQLNNNNVVELGSVYTEIPKDCRSYFFPWNKKIIMIFVGCSADEKKVMESNDMGKNWSVSTEALSRHYKFLQDKHDFVSIKNGTKEILLFTEHSEKTTTDNLKNKDVYLWMSDGNRFKNIAKIAADVDTATPIGFSFADNKLFSLNQQLESSTKKIESVTLKHYKKESTDLISTLIAWDNTDTEVLELCKRQYISEIPCVTNGLVGFLSNSAEGNTKWKDYYLNVIATVTATGSGGEGKAEKIENGFKFNGKGAGAKWLLSEQSKDQPYNFINPGFTLLATVSVGSGTNSKSNSILGVSLTKNTNVGLWCTNNGKWGVSEGDGKTNKQLSEINCTRDNTSYVALTLNSNNKEIYVYVNGKQLSKIDFERTQITQSQDTAYFYFGAVSKANEKETDVNITNVLLYNWPFEEEKITQLKPKQKNVVDAQQTTKSKNDETAKIDKSKTQTNSSLQDTLSTTKEEETHSSSSPPPTAEDSAVRVTVLLSLFFSVFTLFGRYVY